ncbi:MAG: DUF3021 family protein [Fusobacteriaceae bacterium]
MLKRFLNVGVMGATISIMTSLFTSLFISYIFFNDGKLHMVSNALISNKNSEISAFIFQIVVAGVAGFLVSCVATIIFEIDRIKIIFKYILSAIINYGIFILVAILCEWGTFKNNKSVIYFTVIWFSIYFIICFAINISKKNIFEERNKKLQKNN